MKTSVTSTLTLLSKAVVFGGIFMLPFVPLVFLNTLYFPYITEKTIFFRAVVEIVFFFWLLLIALDRSFSLRFSPVIIAVTVFVAVLAAADIFGIDPHRSFWGTFERMEGFITWIHLYAYVLVIGSVLQNRRHWLMFFRTVVSASALVALYGLSQLLGWLPVTPSGTRPGATLGNAIFLSTYVLLALFLTAFLWWNDRRKSWAPYLYGSLLLLDTVVLYGTATRGALLGLLAGAFIGVMFYILDGSAARRRLVFGGLALLVALAALPFLFRHTSLVEQNPLLSRFSTISFSDYSSAQARFFVWDIALQGFAARPFLGWGQENFEYVFNHFGAEEFHTQELWFDRVHDMPLEWLVAAGSVGGIAYIGLFIALLYILFVAGRTGALSRAEQALFFGGIAGYLVSDLFAFDSISSYLLFFTIAGYLHFLSVSGKSTGTPHNKATKHPSDALLLALLCLLLLGAAALEYFSNARPLLAAADIGWALNEQAPLTLAEREGLFNAAFPYASFDERGARDAFGEFAIAVSTAAGASAQGKGAVFSRAEEELAKEISVHPESIRSRLVLAELESAYGNHAQAIAVLNEAARISPEKQFIYFQLGQEYIGQGDYQRAFRAFQTAFEINPRFLEARNLYAAAALYAGQDALAQKLLAERYGTIPADPALIDAYAFRKNYAMLVQLWKERVQENPDDIQARFSLAAAYLAAKRPADAAAELKLIAERYPAAQNQAEQYLQKINSGK